MQSASEYICLVAAMQPLKINSSDDETQRRADGCHIFIHDALHNRGFARVVQTTDREGRS
jgi:hypothetical protein